MTAQRVSSTLYETSDHIVWLDYVPALDDEACSYTLPSAMSSDPRAIIITILVIFFLLIPESPPSSAIGGAGGDHQLDQAVAQERAALELLNRTIYGQFDPPNNRWLNITGLQEEDGFAWAALDAVKARVKQQADHILGREEAEQALSGDTSANLPIYHNISGNVRGSWVRSQIESKFKRPQLNLTALLPSDARVFRSFERNITGDGGDLRFEFEEKGEGRSYNGMRVLDMKATAVIADETSAGDGWSVVLYGHHFVDAGHVILTTSSAKFAGLFALPHFELGENLFRASQEALQPRLQRIIKLQSSREMETINPYSSSIDGSSENVYSPHCDLIAYLQQHPLYVRQKIGASVSVKSPMVADIEKELRFPEGRNNLTPPPFTMSALIFSPDCGFIIESKGQPDYAASEGDHLTGEKQEAYIRAGINYTLLFGIILAGQLYLTVGQMKESSTPSTRSRVSTYTIGLLSLGDGFAGMAFLPLGMLIDSASPALLSTAFMAFLAVCFFDMRFLLDIWTIQVQERSRQARHQAPASTSPNEQTLDTPRQATVPAPVPVITAAGVDSLPLPISSRAALAPGASAVSLTFDQDEPTDEITPIVTATQLPTQANGARRELGSLYGKFYLILLCIVFLSLHATSWYPILRSAYTNIILFIYLSFWTPQIYRNAMRNCRKALLWKFIIGQSLLRLSPIWYFYTVKQNVLWAKTDSHAFFILAGWVWCQVWVLIVQEALGPRLFVPVSWVPPAYDYHPVLREDEEGASMPIGFTQAAVDENALSPVSTRSMSDLQSKDKEAKRKWTSDCAICMGLVEAPVVPAGASEVEGSSYAGNLLARRIYMVTPCRHIFHTTCLESAMRHRLQCPICRESLPPL
ncbi:hypothetical protein EG328_011317 [Venturia inaequalis]|uniref:DSC E3 ubiquitin ligase complex subunit A n=1 Tax=Venturia inaequalis TaxID=5025 RepID=A0A8H3YN10_VENIN|nr:hypothetical protein EG328_011317 [Venturia inaequalis]